MSRLVAIDSVNPSLVPGGAGEAEAAAFVGEWGRAAGLDVEVVGDPARPSVVLRMRGVGGGRSLLLCGHLDTVGVEGMAEPHAPRVDGDWLYGRGSYDMKAGLAAALVTARRRPNCVRYHRRRIWQRRRGRSRSPSWKWVSVTCRPGSLTALMTIHRFGG